MLIALALALVAPAPAVAADPVLSTIGKVEANGSVLPEEASAWRSEWREALKASKRLRGTPGAEMKGVVDNTRTLAKRRRLGARVRAAMKIVEVNVEWFWQQGLQAPANGTRRSFPGSDVVFQRYTGEGWQLQPLANLGTLASLSRRKRITERTRTWAQDLLDLAVRRDGTIAFEYMFPWAGGGPGWASAMPQAVALETYQRLGMAAEARRMLELFRLDPPKGVRFATDAGRAFYVMYPQAPNLLIGNGFAQAVLSLDAYAKLVPEDPVVQDVYQQGLAEARTTMAQYDTGAWSLYYHLPGSTKGSESDAHYHELFRDFLQRLCDRLGGEPFCGMAVNFARYQTEPVQFGTPRIALKKKLIEARVTVSKRSSVTATLFRGETALRTTTVSAAGRGTVRIPFERPKAGGDYRVTLSARALTGQRSETEVTRSVPQRR